ncbi:hypothetical protein PA598K_02115 [Paenibacillus sp. 598K]|uniref:hypothetical protein n=1 Tax=Paenibacillus sp. 598K TaxID=1117987 RepID=UPI000FFA8BCA|nr:hypothetical protein [Paenibacillus sp. 598K]GBF73794.1 hypothetical protein PA598K_02115 [Paenibacillus sp. 598K]
MRKKLIALAACLGLLISGSSYATENDIDRRVAEQFDMTGQFLQKIGLTVRYDEKTQPELEFTGVHVPIRELFGGTTQITWDNNTKTSYIERNGIQLVVSQDTKYKLTKNQVPWPKEWTSFDNGRMLIKFPYLAYIFDRYADFSADSEESEWRERLAFLGIDYIDNNDSTAKDRTMHSFINYK